MASALPFIAARLNHLCAATRSIGTSRPIEYIKPSSKSTSPAAGPSPSGATLLSRISNRAITHSPVYTSRPQKRSRVFTGFFAPADMRIIIGRFEWWFKQCDESNLNRGQLARDFRQYVIKERTALWLVDRRSQLRFYRDFIGQLGNPCRVVYGPPRPPPDNEGAMKN